MARRRALITGITGQDGAYLAAALIARGWEVIGTARRSSTHNDWRLVELGIAGHVRLEQMDLAEFSNILDTVRATRPAAVFNLAAQSYVAASFVQPILTSDLNALGTARLLEAIRLVDPDIRFYQASTSEMFGMAAETPQSETTPFHPRSPYGVSKLYAHWITVNYREAYGMHASSGILFNHESPLRGRHFVTRKISCHFALMAHGLPEPLHLGNLEARRDWGHAREYVDGMIAMVEANQPGDYVLATGTTHSVRDFVEVAARCVGREIAWEGKGAGEIGRDTRTGQILVTIDPKLYRPAEVNLLCGDASRAARALGWRAETGFEGLVTDMVNADLQRLDRSQPLL